MREILRYKEELGTKLNNVQTLQPVQYNHGITLPKSKAYHPRRHLPAKTRKLYAPKN